MSQEKKTYTPNEKAIYWFRTEVLHETDKKVNPDDMKIENLPKWDSILAKIYELWENKYKAALATMQSPEQTEQHFTTFSKAVYSIYTRKPEYSSWKQLYHFIIDTTIGMIQYEANSIGDKENNIMDANEGTSFLKKQLRPAHKKKPYEEQTSYYNHEHMVRCHSLDNNPNDNTTIVHDAAFEFVAPLPTSLLEMAESSALCATVGGYIVNIIDAESGKIVKRFNDDQIRNGIKETYMRAAWTIIGSESVLVAGGKHGSVKVFLPKHSVCVARIPAHETPVECLLFHFKYHDILFTASNDHYIKVWRIELQGTNEASQFKLIGEIEYCEDFQKWDKPAERVLSMCFVYAENGAEEDESHLVISTEQRVYSVLINDEFLHNSPISASRNEHFNDKDVERASAYMTSEALVQRNHSFVHAQLVTIQAKDSPDRIEESCIIDKLLFVNNMLFASIENSIRVYSLRVLNDEIGDGHGMLLKQNNDINYFAKHGEYWSKHTRHSSFQMSKFGDSIRMFKSFGAGFYYRLLGDEKGPSGSAMYSTPPNYNIRTLNDSSQIQANKDNYNLLEPMKVMSLAVSGDYLVITTDQNTVSIYKFYVAKCATGIVSSLKNLTLDIPVLKSMTS